MSSPVKKNQRLVTSSPTIDRNQSLVTSTSTIRSSGARGPTRPAFEGVCGGKKISKRIVDCLVNYVKKEIVDADIDVWVE
jgi:hypothetical protein